MKRLLIILLVAANPSLLLAREAERAPISKDDLARLEKTPRSQDDIRELLKFARSSDSRKKEQALERLSIPDEASKAALSDAYLELLDASDPDLQEAAIRGVTVLNDPRAKKKIRKILRALPKYELRSGRDMTPDTAMESKRAYTAARALAKMGDVDAMDDILDRKALAVSWSILLPTFGNVAISKLVSKARKGTEFERFHALRAIEAMKGAGSVGEIKKLLSDENPDIKRSAAVALAHADSPEALSILDEIYPTLDDVAKFHFAQACVKKCSPARAWQISKDYLENPASGEKLLMVMVLGETGNKDWVPLLEGQLKNKNSVVRGQAACQLARLTGKLYAYQQDGFTRLGEQECPYIKALKTK